MKIRERYLLDRRSRTYYSAVHMETASKEQPMTAIRFVTLTPAQRASHNRKASAWVDTLRALACDDSDPETRDNARAMLARRGL